MVALRNWSYYTSLSLDENDAMISILTNEHLDHSFLLYCTSTVLLTENCQQDNIANSPIGNERLNRKRDKIRFCEETRYWLTKTCQYFIVFIFMIIGGRHLHTHTTELHNATNSCDRVYFRLRKWGTNWSRRRRHTSGTARSGRWWAAGCRGPCSARCGPSAWTTPARPSPSRPSCCYVANLSPTCQSPRHCLKTQTNERYLSSSGTIGLVS